MLNQYIIYSSISFWFLVFSNEYKEYYIWNKNNIMLKSYLLKVGENWKILKLEIYLS